MSPGLKGPDPRRLALFLPATAPAGPSSAPVSYRSLTTVVRVPTSIPPASGSTPTFDTRSMSPDDHASIGLEASAERVPPPPSLYHAASSRFLSTPSKRSRPTTHGGVSRVLQAELDLGSGSSVLARFKSTKVAESPGRGLARGRSHRASVAVTGGAAAWVGAAGATLSSSPSAAEASLFGPVSFGGVPSNLGLPLIGVGGPLGQALHAPAALAPNLQKLSHASMPGVNYAKAQASTQSCPSAAIILGLPGILAQAKAQGRGARLSRLQAMGQGAPVQQSSMASQPLYEAAGRCSAGGQQGGEQHAEGQQGEGQQPGAEGLLCLDAAAHLFRRARRDPVSSAAAQVRRCQVGLTSQSSKQVACSIRPGNTSVDVKAHTQPDT